MDMERIKEIMSQITAGLGAAHEIGVIHRDVKPANILITRKSDDDGRVFDCAKICDFGMAKVFDSEPADVITDVGAVLGTPFYMSPEQASGERVDERTDIYACGVVLYQMATARLPFEAATVTALLLKHLREPVTPPSKLVRDLDPPARADHPLVARERGRTSLRFGQTAAALVDHTRSRWLRRSAHRAVARRSRAASCGRGVRRAQRHRTPPRLHLRHP